MVLRGGAERLRLFLCPEFVSAVSMRVTKVAFTFPLVPVKKAAFHCVRPGLAGGEVGRSGSGRQSDFRYLY